VILDDDWSRYVRAIKESNEARDVNMYILSPIITSTGLKAFGADENCSFESTSKELKRGILKHQLTFPDEMFDARADF
jgi:hypothetical protein